MSLPPVVTVYEHITIDPNGVPLIAGTTMKVVELVTAHLSYGWSPEELHFQYPYLTMGQIHAALAYYWDHRAELDSDMQLRTKYAEQSQLNARTSPLAVKLKAQGLLV
jgi:uncharacterized protein (DUF433 family)